MIAVSGGLIFLGYQLLVYGWSQVSGANVGFFDILWPGRYNGQEFKDAPTSPVVTQHVQAQPPKAGSGPGGGPNLLGPTGVPIGKGGAPLGAGG